MIQSVFTGLKAYYVANPLSSFYVSTGGRFYFGTAPVSAGTPYAVIYDIGTGRQDNWFSHLFERQTVQISIYYPNTANDSDVAITNYGKQCKALFDHATLTISGYSLISFFRDAAQPPLMFDEERRLWHYPVVYEALLQKAR